MNKIIVLTLLSLCSYVSLVAQPKTYKSLYAKAYNLGTTNPDSAIYYAQQALLLAQNNQERAKTHWLKAYYSHQTGYYRLAIQHYQKAYDLYQGKKQKAAMLNNIAYCYKNIGDHQTAIPIATKATQNFTNLQDTTKLISSLNLLGNCYGVMHNYGDADSTLKFAARLAKKIQSGEILKIYSDLARLKAKELEYSLAVHYQKLSLKVYPEQNLSRTCLRFIKLSRYYLPLEKPDSAQYYLNKALAIDQQSLEVKVYLQATKGLLHFINREEAEGKAAYRLCDTVLKQLREHSPHLIQQKYARKTALEVYQSAYDVVSKLWMYGDRAQFAPLKAWFKKRMDTERDRYQDIQVSVALKDSLVIERTTPKTQVVSQVNPWWLALVMTILVVGGWLLYQRRERSLRAYQDFVKAVQMSPIKGFDHPREKEIAMLMEIETRLGRKLRLKEIKILLKIGRGDSYNKIFVDLGIPVGTIKSIVNNLKEKCKVENIRDLM